ncbi:hypothetical protein J4446_03095 [Candidatus Woesearchaeota archaeon]|nr:hypothetical protein [Candidatus Woesearchaeota archaeon]
MMKKLLSVFLVLVIALSGISFAGAATAVPLVPFKIVDVDIDGTDMSDVNTLYVERGETLNIRVEVQTSSLIKDVDYTVDDVRVKADIAGYEYDDIEDTTEMFDMEGGVRYVKNLKLSIPEDIDASENYKLRVRVYSQDYEIDISYELRVKSQRHLLNIQDVIFTPGLVLNTNQPLFTTVRVENMGDNKEEDVRVEVSVPELGRSGITYIDELVSVENDDEETSASSDTIYMDLRGAKSGIYELFVKVEYNRGHDEVTKSYQLVIDGATVASGFIVESAEKSISSESGQGIVYKIDIANMGSDAKSFTAEVSGLNWGNYRVDPTPVVVQAGSNGEMFIYVSPNEDVIGQNTFTVNVKEGSNVVKTINFEANISKEKSEWSNVLTGLEIGFVVLLIILVILGIILAVTRMNKKEDEEPLGESYY